MRIICTGIPLLKTGKRRDCEEHATKECQFGGGSTICGSAEPCSMPKYVMSEPSAENAATDSANPSIVASALQMCGLRSWWLA